MSEEEKESSENSTFKVSDRRSFTAEGELIDEGKSDKASREGEATASSTGFVLQSDGSGTESPNTQEESGQERQPIDFPSFLLSLATSAMAYLGEVPDPNTGLTTENLEGAQQMIDILTVLEEKTKGNLDADESQLLENLLYELRMKYLSRVKLV